MNTVNITIKKVLNREEKHLNTRDSQIKIEYTVTDNASGAFALIRLVNFGMMAVLCSFKLQTTGGRTNE